MIFIPEWITPPAIGKDGVFAIKPYCLDDSINYLWIVARQMPESGSYVTHIYNGQSVGYGNGYYFEDDKERCMENFLTRTR